MIPQCKDLEAYGVKFKPLILPDLPPLDKTPLRKPLQLLSGLGIITNFIIAWIWEAEIRGIETKLFDFKYIYI